MIDTKDINPKNRPYLRRVKAANQPLVAIREELPWAAKSGKPAVKTIQEALGTKAMGPNRKERRARARWLARPKNQVAVRKALKAKAEKTYTMRPGVPKAPKKSFFKGGRA